MSLVFVGVLLIGLGIAVIAAELPARWVLGPVLVAVGVLIKLTGFARTATPAPGRRAATGSRPAARRSR